MSPLKTRFNAFVATAGGEGSSSMRLTILLTLEATPVSDCTSSGGNGFFLESQICSGRTTFLPFTVFY
jgi:hypothetical protein